MEREILRRLYELQQKGAAWQSQPKAESLLVELKELITPAEYGELITAHQHYLHGEGAQEFRQVINNLLTKYRRGNTDLKFDKTFA